jgi:adenosylcobyric acid synthase
LTVRARSAPALMLQGTGSDVGKSLLAAGLCRAYVQRGLKVRPFKPQNMSNNAAVTSDGGEIGRAQALQARAARVAPSRHMNPVLLKPQTETGAQVVVQGRVYAYASAKDYHALKPKLMPRVLESFDILSGQADLVIVEGAGSAAEINLRAADIANMGFALAANVPVVLVGDIDRGGVLAQIVGVDALIAPSERALLKGYLINKFRGDIALFRPALDIIGDRTGLSCLGVVPYFHDARRLPAEDGMALETKRETGHGGFKIAVPRSPRIANFDDLDPLIAEPVVSLVFVEPGQALPGDADLVILPGSKATRADLAFFRQQGWDIDLKAHIRRGGRVVGLCGGYQMLGTSVRDPDGIEGPPGSEEGLGFLDIETVLMSEKALKETSGTERATGLAIKGYEMHMGVSTGPGRERPMLDLADGRDGAVSADGRVMGCYLHGLFAEDAFRRAFLGIGSTLSYESGIEEVLDRLASHIASHVDLDRLLTIARGED